MPQLGVLLICYSVISQFVVTDSQMEAVYLLAAILLGKAVFPINYLVRRARDRNQSNQKRKDINSKSNNED